MTDKFMSMNKILLFGLIILAAVTMVILSSSLDQINLRRGMDVSLPQEVFEPNPGTSVFGLAEMQDNFASFYRTFSRFIFWVIIPMLTIIYLISPSNRRRKLMFILLFIALVVFTPFVVQLLTQDIDPNVFEPEITPAPEIIQGEVVTPPATSPDSASPTIGYILSALLIVAIALFLGFLYSRDTHNGDASITIQEQTDQALSALSQGHPIENVIIKLYSDMCDFLNQKRGVQRKAHMTPREFQENLEDMGVPAEASRTLTRFFEAARYGSKNFDRDAQAQAIQCLTTIKESAANFENN